MLATKMTASRRGLIGMSLALLLGSAPIGALAEAAQQVEDDPVAFVRLLGQQAIAVLADQDLNSADRQRVFRELLIDRFDMPSIGRLVMGRHWRRATAEQRDVFGPLFQDFVVATYGRRLEAYSGEQLTMGRAREVSKKVTGVSSKVTRRQGQPIDVSWMLHRKDGRWYVIDVVIEGISMVISQRSEFAAVIGRRGGIDGLIESIRSRIDLVSTDHRS